jgi:hypothetical protein
VNLQKNYKIITTALLIALTFSIILIDSSCNNSECARENTTILDTIWVSHKTILPIKEFDTLTYVNGQGKKLEFISSEIVYWYYVSEGHYDEPCHYWRAMIEEKQCSYRSTDSSLKFLCRSGNYIKNGIVQKHETTYLGLYDSNYDFIYISIDHSSNAEKIQTEIRGINETVLFKKDEIFELYFKEYIGVIAFKYQDELWVLQ